MSHFLYDHDRVTTVGINPETKNEVESIERVPRNLPSLGDKSWEDVKMICEALGLQIGRAVRHTKVKNTEVRDVFFTKVRGGPSPTGGNYPYLRVGVLFSNTRQDSETGEIVRWHSFALEGEEQVPPAQTPAPSTPEAPAKGADEAPAKTEAEMASEVVGKL